MRDILPPTAPGAWPDPALGHDDLDLPEARRPGVPDDQSDGTFEPEQPRGDPADRPDVLPDVAPPEDQA